MAKVLEANQFQGDTEGWKESAVQVYQQAKHVRAEESPKPAVTGGRELLAEARVLRTQSFLWHLFIPALDDSRLTDSLV